MASTSPASRGLDEIRKRLTAALRSVENNGHKNSDYNLGYLRNAVEDAIELTLIWGDR